MDVKGGSALIVRGAGGFGAATTRRLVEAGVQVIIADMAEENGEALATELGAAARFVETDVLSEDSVAAAVEAAKAMGPLRACVVVNGGPAAGSRLINREGKRYPLATFRRTVDIFLNGTFHVLSQAAEAMATNEPQADNQRGVIITTASIAGFEGQVGQTD